MMPGQKINMSLSVEESLYKLYTQPLWKGTRKGLIHGKQSCYIRTLCNYDIVGGYYNTRTYMYTELHAHI